MIVFGFRILVILSFGVLSDVSQESAFSIDYVYWYWRNPSLICTFLIVLTVRSIIVSINTATVFFVLLVLFGVSI